MLLACVLVRAGELRLQEGYSINDPICFRILVGAIAVTKVTSYDQDFHFLLQAPRTPEGSLKGF